MDFRPAESFLTPTISHNGTGGKTPNLPAAGSKRARSPERSSPPRVSGYRIPRSNPAQSPHSAPGTSIDLTDDMPRTSHASHDSHRAVHLAPSRAAGVNADKPHSHRAVHLPPNPAAVNTDNPPNYKKKQIPAGAAGCLKGKTFVRTGTMDSLLRAEVEQLIARYGGKISEKVNAETSFLLRGIDTASGRLIEGRKVDGSTRCQSSTRTSCSR